LNTATVELPSSKLKVRQPTSLRRLSGKRRADRVHLEHRLPAGTPFCTWRFRMAVVPIPEPHVDVPIPPPHGVPIPEPDEPPPHVREPPITPQPPAPMSEPAR